MRVPSLTAAVLAFALQACSGETSPAPTGEGGGETVREDTVPFDARIYERKFAFVSLDRDSLAIIPWLFGTETRLTGDHRQVRGWMLRNGQWDPFIDEELQTDANRFPWRILPAGRAGIVVGADDSVEALLFRGGARRLELELGERLTEWSGPLGESFRLVNARASIVDERVDGLLLDVRRGRRKGDPDPGDWLFLVSDENLQLVLDRPTREGSPDGSARAWTRIDSQDTHWPEIRMEWTERRPFEPARRDVPVAWRLRTPGGEVVGELEVAAAALRALESDRPIAPVEGLFEVHGEVRVEGRTFQVAGLVRHAQN